MAVGDRPGWKPDVRLKAANLWERTSAAGNRYLVGRLGGVRVLVLENRRRESDDDPTHELFFAEALDRARQPTPAGKRQPVAARSAPRTRAAAQRPRKSAEPASHEPFLDDPVDDIGR